MEAIPPTGEDLVNALDRAYPLRNPGPSQNINEIMFKAGQRSVIETLRLIQKQEAE